MRNIESEILDKAVSALREETGLRILESKRFDPKDYWVDFQILLQSPNNNLQTRNYWAQVTKGLTNAKLGEAALTAKRTPEKFVLITDYVTQPQAAKLRELDVAFFDAAGNAYFNEPGLYIFVSGNKSRTEKTRTPRLLRTPGIKILFALLTRSGLENESYRAISAATNVPTPTVGVFMNDLERAGYLVRHLNNSRSIVKRGELFRRWVTAYGETFRETLNPVWFRSTKYEGRWWDAVEIAEYKAVWGGETGGARLTHYLNPATATIYSDSRLPRLQAKYGLVKDQRGNIEILEKFWTTGEVGDVAPPLVVYADLIATADERNIETAEMIYERYLDQLTGTTA